MLKELCDRRTSCRPLVLRYRELAKIKSTYIDALPRMRAGDGRVHTCFNETVTTTGRLSSSDPNLQNIPVRTEFGRQIRESFVPLAPDERFLSADYSQIELRLLAHLSGDEHLVAAFCSGADFHAATAARVFDVPVEEVTPELRSRAKAVNFGIVYGQQAFGLSQSLGIPFGEAKEMIERYFAAYPGVRAYLDATIEEAKAKGYAETMFGRKRHIPELKASNAATRGFGERTAMNHPMQGSAADIIKLAMTEVQRRLMAEGFEARLLPAGARRAGLQRARGRDRGAVLDGEGSDGGRRGAPRAPRGRRVLGRQAGRSRTEVPPPYGRRECDRGTGIMSRSLSLHSVVARRGA